MAITIQSSGSFSRPSLTAALSFSFPITVAAGSNTRLALAVSGSKGAINAQSIPQYGGVALTADAAASSTDTLTIVTRWYVLDAPAVGTANITITNPSNNNDCAYFWIVVDGALAGSAGSIGNYAVTAITTPTTATVGPNDLAIVAAVFLAGNPTSMVAGTTAIGATSIDTAQGAAAKGWAGYKVGASPAFDGASGQLAWATLVIPGAAGGGDTTAPTLTSPTGTGGVSLCSGSVTTDEANGTLYSVVTASATAPTAAQVKLGQDHTGAAALRVVSQAVSATGAQAVVSGAVTAGTRYFHFMHEDAAANQSTVSSSASFTVTAPASASLTSSPLKNNTGTLQTSAAAEAYVSNVTTGALVVKKTGLTSHATTGVITFSDAALTAATSYRVVWRLTSSGAEGLETLTAA